MEEGPPETQLPWALVQPGASGLCGLRLSRPHGWTLGGICTPPPGRAPRAGGPSSSGGFPFQGIRALKEASFEDSFLFPGPANGTSASWSFSQLMAWARRRAFSWGAKITPPHERGSALCGTWGRSLSLAVATMTSAGVPPRWGLVDPASTPPHKDCPLPPVKLQAPLRSSPYFDTTAKHHLWFLK